MLAIASDHGGLELKTKITAFLDQLNIGYTDFGTHSADSCDYPDLAELACKAIASGECDRGILVCGTGVGISIAANKMRGIRAALCNDLYTAKMCRLHNDANVLALGGRILGEGLALEIVRCWLDTGFEGGRHAARLEKIARLESSNR